MFNRNRYIDRCDHIIIKIKNDDFWYMGNSIPYYSFSSKCTIPKSEIICQEKNIIVCKYVQTDRNSYSIGRNCIEKKENKIINEINQIITFKYCGKGKWKHFSSYNFAPTIKEIINPLDTFKNQFYCKYKLIESKEEFNEYLKSSLDCDTWCQKKLYTKMKELGFDDYFIQYNAGKIGNDLYKYHRMINLANEIEEKDLLKQIFLMKFLDE